MWKCTAAQVCRHRRGSAGSEQGLGSGSHPTRPRQTRGTFCQRCGPGRNELYQPQGRTARSWECSPQISSVPAQSHRTGYAPHGTSQDPEQRSSRSDSGMHKPEDISWPRKAPQECRLGLTFGSPSARNAKERRETDQHSRERKASHKVQSVGAKT